MPIDFQSCLSQETMPTIVLSQLQYDPFTDETTLQHKSGHYLGQWTHQTVKKVKDGLLNVVVTAWNPYFQL